MALSWNTLRAIPRLTSYTAAAAYEASVKPIRGRTPETKPLGRRSQTHFTIKRDENGDILLSTWYGVFARYRTNDDLVLYDRAGWSKASENELITEVTGMPCRTYHSKVWVTVSGGENYLRPSARRVYDHKEQKWVDNPAPPNENIFRRNENDLGWTYINPPGVVVHHIRRKEMQQVMKRYAAFTDYAVAMHSLHADNPVTPEAYIKPFGIDIKPYAQDSRLVRWWSKGIPESVSDVGFRHEQAAQLCEYMLSEDAEDNYRAYLWLARPKGYHSVDELDITANIKRVVTMHYHEQVLKEVEVTSGRASRDQYMWAIPAQS